MHSSYKRSSLAIAIIGAFAMMAASSASRAAITYTYAAGSSSYTAAVAGDPVSVPLYLIETVSGGSTSLLSQENGLFGAGLDISRTSGAASITGITPNPAFGGLPQSSVGAGSASFTESMPMGATAGVPATILGNGVSEVQLGTLQLTSAVSPSTFQLSEYVNGNQTIGGNTLTFNNFYDLDVSSSSPSYSAAASSSFSVTSQSTPEPVFGAATAAAAIVMLRPRRRRRSI